MRVATQNQDQVITLFDEWIHMDHGLAGASADTYQWLRYLVWKGKGHFAWNLLKELVDSHNFHKNTTEAIYLQTW